MVKSKNLKRLGHKVQRPVALADQINQDESVKPPKKSIIHFKDEDENDTLIGGSLGRNIIKQSWAQIQEINNEENDDEEWPALGASDPLEKKQDKFEVSFSKSGVRKKPAQSSVRGSQEEEEGEDEEVDELQNAIPVNVDSFIRDFEKDLNLDNEDLDILDHFKSQNSDPQRRLADIFRDKITEKQTEIQTEVDAQSNFGITLSPDLQKMCEEIGQVLSRYRSGPLPKAFKAFPNMNCWEELIYHTKPDNWSAAAMYQATRIFISNLQAAMAQRFLNLVLLPRIRDDISYYKRLNYHLYQALCKALFKSSAFFKGILLPLCNAGDCTLREAIIVGSVIAKNHIPIDNSAAAIKKIASMDYSGPNSIFLRVFFDKKYALPYQVLDECCDHFRRFEREVNDLPVLWHQSLLSFVQRYKNDISSDQKNEILRLINIHSHPTISSEIRREIVTSEKKQEPMAVDG